MNDSEQDRLLTAVEVARVVGRSTSGVKRLADELRLDVRRTGNGTRLFKAEHVEKMRTEIQRRAVEAAWR